MVPSAVGGPSASPLEESHAPPVDVLVVDDDPAVRTSFTELLRSGDYSVAEAVDCESAMERLGALRVGVVVLDVLLPGLSGLWLLDEVEDLPPVILVTGHLYDPGVLARRDKVFMFLEKPVHPPQLLKAVAAATGRLRDSGPT